MRDGSPAATGWAFVAVVAVMAAVTPDAGLRVAGLAIGALSVVPLLGWLRQISFTPPLAAAAAAVVTALLLGSGQAVPVALVVAVATGALVGGVVTAVVSRLPADIAPWVSLTLLLVVTTVALPRVGLVAAPRPLLFGIDLGGDRALAITGVLLLAVASAVVANAAAAPLRSQVVVAATAPPVARRSGIGVAAACGLAGALAGGVAALAGMLATLAAQTAPSPAQFGVATAVTWTAVAYIGGAGSSRGVVAAALGTGALAATMNVPDIAVAGVALALWAAATRSPRPAPDAEQLT